MMRGASHQEMIRAFQSAAFDPGCLASWPGMETMTRRTVSLWLSKWDIHTVRVAASRAGQARVTVTTTAGSHRDRLRAAAIRVARITIIPVPPTPVTVVGIPIGL